MQWIDRGWYLISDFQATHSRQFEDTLNVAKNSGNFIELCDEQGTIVYRNVFRVDNLHEFSKLYPCIGKWKKTKIYVCGEEISGSLPGGVLCMMIERCRYMQPDIPDYLGCSKQPIRLRLDALQPHLNGSKGRYWFEYASFTGKYFLIQKEQIKNTYLSVTSKSQWKGCPLFRMSRDLAIIDRLPDKLFLNHPELSWKVFDLCEEGGRDGQNFIDRTFQKVPWPESLEGYSRFISRIVAEAGCDT